MIDFTIFLAITPILLIIVLMLMRLPLKKAAPITFLYTLVLAYFYWKVTNPALFGSTLRGLLVAIDISIIIFGALFLLEFLKKTKIIYSIENYLSTISPDVRIQALLLVWFFGSFIEGAAGFGTPAAIIAPLLVGIGFPVITAISIALIGNSAAVVFGAVGTPIRVGFSGLEVAGVATQAALINIAIGLLVPLAILGVLIYNSSQRNWQRFKEIIPLSILSGFLLVAPSYLVSFLGEEFPSLLGPLIGLMLMLLVIKHNVFVPKHVMKFKRKEEKKEDINKVKAILPYGLLVLFLIIGRFFLGSKNISLTSEIQHTINFFNPGLAFILAIIFFSFIYKISYKEIKEPLKKSFKTIKTPFIVIFFITAFVQIMINSWINFSGLESMIITMTNLLNLTLLPFITPLLGAFGSFVTGSATVSNILFGAFFQSAAQSAGLQINKVLALQVIGAAIGNMIALTNIVAAQAATGISGKELDILKITIIPCIILLVVAGIIGGIIL